LELIETIALSSSIQDVKSADIVVVSAKVASNSAAIVLLEEEPFSSFTVFQKRFSFPKSVLRVEKSKIEPTCYEI